MYMNEIECPYCEKSFDLCHDDGAYLSESSREEAECEHCGKCFMVSSSVSWYFEGEKADCLNGGEHDWQQSGGAPVEHFIGRFYCTQCDRKEYRDEEGREKAMKEKYA